MATPRITLYTVILKVHDNATRRALTSVVSGNLETLLPRLRSYLGLTPGWLRNVLASSSLSQGTDQMRWFANATRHILVLSVLRDRKDR